MRMKIYNFLVNRHSGIRSRYHRFHDNGGLFRRGFSYVYLLCLNFCYYILFFHFLDQPEQVAVYEEKNLPVNQPESERGGNYPSEYSDYIENLSNYDVVSFDIFDTLIFRPFSEPTDVFFFLAKELGILDFKRIRTEQEYLARTDCYKEKGHYEVTLTDIWKRIERETGVPAEKGMRLEQELEEHFCYANPFMQQVFHALQKKGKKIIVVSDMYLSGEFLLRLLEKNGYTGISKLYVSCEYGMSKGNGKLYELVKREWPDEKSFIHVGDNEKSDVGMAKKCGFASAYYANVNKMSLSFRPYDMSPVIGGAYRGIVNNHLYCGLQTYSLEYEYGFIYGGLFVLGYCFFIHEYCRKNGIDKLLFLSRDGDILKQVYDRLYPETNTSYVYWSRTAAIKLMAPYDRYDYFRRFLYHKVNHNIPIKKILQSMELELLGEKLDGYQDMDTAGNRTDLVLHLNDVLTDRNVDALKRFLQLHFDEIIAVYRNQDAAAKEYYAKELADANLAAAVDIGWAGSGAMSLSYLVERVWKLPCEIRGIIAGTNTVHNVEPDASEIFLQSEKLTAYLFSQTHNRDIMKKHDLNKDYNVYWELLLSSPTRQFTGFGYETEGQDNGRQVIKLNFGKEDINQEGIREIQKGILDFAEIYYSHFKEYPYMLQISGRDAYAPMLLAAGHKEKYLKEIEKRFHLEIGVN